MTLLLLPLPFVRSFSAVYLPVRRYSLGFAIALPRGERRGYPSCIAGLAAQRRINEAGLTRRCQTGGVKTVREQIGHRGHAIAARFVGDVDRHLRS